MKKSKFTLCLTSGFVVAMSLAACGSAVSADNEAIVTVKDSEGHVINVASDAIYNKSMNSKDSVGKFYNAVLEALIRYEYANTNAEIKGWTKAIKTEEQIKQEAADKVADDQKTAEANKKNNGTSYEEEWENILKSHNCLPGEDDNESGAEKLLQYYIYQLEKEDITDKFYTQQKKGLTQEWFGIDKNGNSTFKTAKGAFPYHIRHVLCSLSTSSSGTDDFYKATISEENAQKLGDIMSALTDNAYKFYQVASDFKDDPNSAKIGGSLGIMTNTTSFVNEFKLGIYAFDAIYNHDDGGQPATGALKVIREGLGLHDDYTFDLRQKGSTAEPTPVTAEQAFETIINNGNIQTVPYQAFLKIKEYKDVTLNSDGEKVNDGNENYYPRNILFNYYLNFRNPFLITDEGLDANGWRSGHHAEEFPGRFVDFYGQKVLCDDEQNIIIGVRSDHGIHFMVIEHSIFQYGEGGEGHEEPSLEEYYTTYTPGDDEFPQYNGKDKDVFVNYVITEDVSTYNSRSATIKDSVKSFDSTYDYRLFDYITNIEDGKVTINDTSLKPIKQLISDYISRTRDGNLEDADKTLNEAWRTYVEKLALQYETRTDYNSGTTTDVPAKIRTIHPRCAIGFADNTGADWIKGGMCYAK